MKNIFHIVLAVAVSLSAFAAGSPNDAKAVQGNWKPVKAELGGQPMPDAVLKMISLKLGNGKYEVFAGEEPDRGTYTLGSSSKPKSMIITGTKGSNHGNLMIITPILAEGVPPTVLVVFLVPLFLGVLALRSIAASKRTGRTSRTGLMIRLVPVLIGGLLLFFFLTVRGGAPGFFIAVAAFPLVAGLLSLYYWGRKKPEASRAVAIKGNRFKFPELNGFPPEKQEEVLRRCLESEEFARKKGRIRLACLGLTVVAAIAVLNILDWAGITGDQHWSNGVNVAVVIVFLPVMVFSQMWFRGRLLRKLVRREIAHA